MILISWSFFLDFIKLPGLLFRGVTGVTGDGSKNILPEKNILFHNMRAWNNGAKTKEEKIPVTPVTPVTWTLIVQK